MIRQGEKRNAYRVLIGKVEGRRPLGIPRHGWENNIKVNIKGRAWDDINCIKRDQNRA
jgi:hypothetical protein